jgi:cell shape-determining protein MreD|tara:strand:- start:246 stop:587 length:342 start_codon:yes stop_codon:yes gene_type:complete
MGYVHIFFAGLINDVVIGFPIGLSAFSYLLICGFSAYLRNITLRPSLINDWFFFLFTILVVTAVNYILLSLIFSVEINYYDLVGNIFFTFLLYIVFAYIFNKYQKYLSRGNND